MQSAQVKLTYKHTKTSSSVNALMYVQLPISPLPACHLSRSDSLYLSCLSSPPVLFIPLLPHRVGLGADLENCLTF